MSRSYKFHDKEKLYFVSFATVNWIDVFIRRTYKDIMVNSLRHCINEKGLELYAWCIMTSHPAERDKSFTLSWAQPESKWNLF